MWRIFINPCLLSHSSQDSLEQRKMKVGIWSSESILRDSCLLVLIKHANPQIVAGSTKTHTDVEVNLPEKKISGISSCTK